MRAILSLFVKSPFAPLQKHMAEVTCCMESLQKAFLAYFEGSREEVEEITKEISKLEHDADLTKNDIRNHLPQSLFLPVGRGSLLEILALQDSLADKAEDVSILLTFRPFETIEGLQQEFVSFLDKNMESFHKVRQIIDELNELLQSSFGGAEAEKVKQMVDDVAYKEHEADLIQRKLVRLLYNSEDQFSYTAFSFWLRLVEEVGSIANLSEKLANRVRMTLDLN